MAIGGVVNPNAAINAYSNSQNITGIGSVTNVGKDINAFAKNDSIHGNGEVSFADLVKQGTIQSIDTMKAGETMSAKAITGDANITDVVQSVTSAEITLQTLVSVRDKMISAYQDIMRMPI